MSRVEYLIEDWTPLRRNGLGQYYCLLCCNAFAGVLGGFWILLFRDIAVSATSFFVIMHGRSELEPRYIANARLIILALLKAMRANFESPEVDMLTSATTYMFELLLKAC